jgi:lambda repressor-like predicted transcriptional regulator
MYSNIVNFEQWLELQLKARNMKVTQLSKLCGVHPNTIRNYLARRCEPSYFNVVLIVNALGYKLEAVEP